MNRALRRLMQRLGHEPWFAAVGKRVAPHLDRLVHRVSRGKIQLSDAFLPTLILIHTGRKSGREYQTPLAYLPHDEGYVIVGSNWGQQQHPAWTHNLLADPQVAIEMKGQHVPVTARPVTASDERAELWERLTSMWPAYDTYVERAGDRQIRLFVLTPDHPTETAD